MNIQVMHVGTTNPDIQIIWPEDWPVPREGDSFTVPGLNEVTTVRSVVWYPHGYVFDGQKEPFVYVVVGPRGPR